MKACCTLDISGEEEVRLVNMLKAAGNSKRFQILKFLVTHPGCMNGQIVEFLPIAQATVSQHLKVLKQAGWISGDVEGTASCYSLDADNISWFKEKVGDIF